MDGRGTRVAAAGGAPMEPLRYPRLWFGLGVGAMLAGLALALAPLGGPVLFSWSDKLIHFLAFAFFAVWFLGIVDPGRTSAVLAALAGYGIVIEILQALTPYRAAEVFDVLSDVAGIGAGWLLASAGLRRWCRRVEAFLGATRP